MWNSFSVILKESFDSSSDSPKKSQRGSAMRTGIWMAPQSLCTFTWKPDGCRKRFFFIKKWIIEVFPQTLIH